MFLSSLILNTLPCILDSWLSYCKMTKVFLPLSRIAVKAHAVSLTFCVFCSILQVVLSTSWAKLEENFERKYFSSLLSQFWGIPLWGRASHWKPCLQEFPLQWPLIHLVKTKAQIWGRNTRHIQELKLHFKCLAWLTGHSMTSVWLPSLVG